MPDPIQNNELTNDRIVESSHFHAASVMKFLFTGPGYPGVADQVSVSGIAVYLRNMAEGLMMAGHECHVLIWGTSRSVETINGVTVHAIQHSYWPVLERWMPESRDVFNLTRKVLDLDSRYNFDWIEIESDEGQGIGVQQKLPTKVILRIHTTLAQMVDVKQVEKTAKVRYRLRRELRSIQNARRLVTHSQTHADFLKKLFPCIQEIPVVHHGIPDPLSLSPGLGGYSRPDKPSFLVVGTADRRKGFDRIRGVIDTYSKKYGACRLVIVSSGSREKAAVYGLNALSDGVELCWLSHLDDASLLQRYVQSSCLLHLARYESFGYPLIEAAAMSLPVVTTNVGIAGELLRELPEFIVDGDDPDEVAERLHDACLQKERVGKVLRAAYQKSFTADIMVQNYLKVLAAWRD